ncbi:MAG TPA: NTP transferase domain-containing protein [Firmicutes bacterium]|nr:NTP transferase domain-containing protein [Bacillota bacterium]
MKAVILAGSAGETLLTRQEGVKNKNFIRLGDRLLISYVLDALRELKDLIDEIIVVGPEEELKGLSSEYAFTIIPEEGTIGKNIMASYLRGLLQGHFLLVTGDIPLLTAKAVKDFLENCRPYDLDFYYSIIPKEINEAKYPEAKRTYVTLRDGTFTGGNLFVVRAEKIPECLPRVENFISLRKSPVKMVFHLGIPFLLKFVFRRLTIRDLTNRFKVMIGAQGKAVVTNYPEIGTDLDKPRDVAFFRKQLGG